MALLTVLQWRGFGVSAVRQLANFVKHDGRDLDFESAVVQVFGAAKLPGPNERNAARSDARKLIDKCAKLSIHITSLCDPVYPSELRKIKDAPPLLYVKGRMTALSELGCAVVGTRKASNAGLSFARKIGRVLAENGFSTISGLALGIDAAGHEGALEGSGTTIAILAHGLHTVAPASNRPLAEQIIETGGALISEHEPDVPPRPAEFVRRNRIQSGISICSIVVESAEKGGAIHQARFTVDQGRPLFTVLPEDRHLSNSSFDRSGGDFLVRELGASRIRSAEELIDRVKQIRDALSHHANEAPSDEQYGFKFQI